ncbi:MAG: radical SAM protein [Candidatus Korarchaeum sp.]
MPFEEGGFYDKDPRSFELRVALVYPGPYEVAVSSLGHQMLYFSINSMEGVMAERFVTDLRGSVESGRPIGEFDVIVATLHFEGQYQVLLRMIEGIRKPILVGGPAVSFNPLPMSPLVKAVGLGDSEGLLEEALMMIKEDHRDPPHPSLFSYECRNKVRFNRTFKLKPLLNQLRLIENGLIVNKFLLEISRGCNWGCRFCGIGWHWRPRVDLQMSQILEALDSAQEQGFSEVFIIGSDAASLRVLKDALGEITSRGLRASVPSLRADQVDAETLSLLREVGERMVTLAPETGSERIKEIVNKRIDNDEVLRAVEEARNLGFKHVKLYFMIGLPFESESDVVESAELARRVNHVLRTKVSLSVFVPKAGTPFERAPLLREEEFRRRVSIFRKNFGGDLNISHYGRAFIQALLSLGGFEIGELLRRSFNKPFNRRVYETLARELGMDVDKLVYGDRETPWWDYIDDGIRRRLLSEEFERARLAGLGHDHS